MRGINFCQGCIAFIILVLSICLLSFFDMNSSFITNLLLTIFTIAISIFFYNESNKNTNLIKDLVTRIQGDVSSIKSQQDKAQNLITKPSSINKNQIRRIYIKDG